MKEKIRVTPKRKEKSKKVGSVAQRYKEYIVCFSCNEMSNTRIIVQGEKKSKKHMGKSSIRGELLR